MLQAREKENTTKKAKENKKEEAVSYKEVEIKENNKRKGGNQTKRERLFLTKQIKKSKERKTR